MSPAECIVETFGDGAKAARAAGVDRSRVCRWRKSREEDRRNGRDGMIPERYWQRLIAEAASRGLHLTIEHLRSGNPSRRVVRMR